MLDLSLCEPKLCLKLANVFFQFSFFSESFYPWYQSVFFSSICTWFNFKRLCSIVFSLSQISHQLSKCYWLSLWISQMLRSHCDLPWNSSQWYDWMEDVERKKSGCWLKLLRFSTTNGFRVLVLIQIDCKCSCLSYWNIICFCYLQIWLWDTDRSSHPINPP